MVRKMMQMSWITKTFTENPAAGTYTLINKSPMSTLTWTFKFRETMEGMGFDGKKHAVRVDAVLQFCLDRLNLFVVAIDVFVVRFMFF